MTTTAYPRETFRQMLLRWAENVAVFAICWVTYFIIFLAVLTVGRFLLG